MSFEGGEPGMRLGSRFGLVLGGITFLLVTGAIFAYQVHRIPDGDTPLEWSRLRWAYLLLGLLCLPVETLAAAVRTSIVCRVLQPRVSLWTCVKAEWANVALNMLTPCHAGGGPAQIYMMSRTGVRAGTALTISLMSFVGTIAGLLSISLYTMLVSDIGQVRALSVMSLALLTGIAAAMALAAWRPEAFRIVLGAASRTVWRLRGRRDPLPEWRSPDDAGIGPAVDRMGRLAASLAALIHTYRAEVNRFLRAGTTSLVWVYLLSLAFICSRGLLAYLCVRFLGVDEGSFRRIVEIQMAMAFLVLFAPTPGGAGIAEGASLSLTADIVPTGIAPYYNLLWRLSTAYLAAIAGLVCLSRALLQDGRRAMRSRRIGRDA